jgi:hypothetical protein
LFDHRPAPARQLSRSARVGGRANLVCDALQSGIGRRYGGQKIRTETS